MIGEAPYRTGRINWWCNGENGYGYIRPEDGGEAVFAHHTCISPYTKAESLYEGVRVAYRVDPRKMGGLWAEDIFRIG